MRHIVLLHGFAATPAAWARVVPLLGPAVEVTCPSLAGHGGQPVQASSFMEEVDRLAQLITAEHAGADTELCGYSMGGRFALGLLARHWRLFQRATIVGAHPGLVDESDRIARRMSDELWASLIEGEGLEAFVERWEKLPLFDSQRRLPAHRLATQRQMRLSHRPAELAKAMRLQGLGHMPELGARLRDVPLPVRVVVGELDSKFLPIARDLSTVLPRAELCIVPGCGHNVVLEDPAAVAALLQKE